MGKTWIVRITGKIASLLVMIVLSLQSRLFSKIPSEKVHATVFLEFLTGWLAEYPRRKIFVRADQISPHVAKSVKAFVDSSAKPRVVLPAGDTRRLSIRMRGFGAI